MKKPIFPIIIVVVLGALLFFVRKWQGDDETTTKKTTTTTKPKTTADKNPTGVNRNYGFDRRTSYLEYTEHAKCRMQCRRISQAEVEEIMRDGKINYAKSDTKAKPCPTYALEGVTRDDQRVRIVFAQCDFKTKVVTTIDLETDWSCACPGDDSKHQNQR
ncbi:MAG: DUF4258 domain-containing protein [Chitinophagaceae bacterium]|nr:DUF4258 domain-containing protein [Chitinophagaceae bacterium]